MSVSSGILFSNQETSNELSQGDIQELLDNIELLDPDEQNELLQIAATLETRERARACRENLIEFCKAMDKNYLVGTHHKHLANLLMEVERGEKDRITVSIAPRHGKSRLTSEFYTAWYLGKNPTKQVMLVSHTADLAVDFGRKVRNLIDTPEYQQIFPGVSLASDSKSAGRWNTNQGGIFYATGVGSSLAGRGADLLICLAATARVITPEGRKQAQDVKVGDEVLGYKGFHKVTKVFQSTHTQQVVLNQRRDQAMSLDHPVWTYNRGWVVAGSLTTHDVLDTINLLQHLKVGARYVKERTRASVIAGLQHLGDDAPALHKPKSGKLHKLWGARDNLLRSVGEVFKFLCRHGEPAVATAHSGSSGQQWTVLPRELPVGISGTTTEQPAQQRAYNRVWSNFDHLTVAEENGAVERPDNASYIPDEDARRGCFEGRSNELGTAPYRLSQFGWIRRAAFRIISRCGAKNGRKTGIFVGCAEAFFSSAVCGLLLGVRRPKTVTIEDCGSSTQFYNFHIPEFNTVYVDSWMTHNCDDPVSEQDMLAGNFDALEKAYEWYRIGARTRLMPGGRVAIVGTRWHTSDLIGRVIRDMALNPESDQFEVVEFPAILNEHTEDEKALWPEFFDLEALRRTRATMPAYQWNAQYQQNPTGEETALIKREWWKRWQKDKPPECEYIIMTLDAAAEKGNRNDYTGMLVFGVWFNEEDNSNHLILLNAVKQRMEFPELKTAALEWYKEWQPDSFIVEKKSSGTPLYQELRRMGVPVSEFTPHRGTGDKVARLNAVADIVRSGLVWIPETRWADEMVEEVGAFPNGDHDDLVDCLSMLLARFRQGGFITLPSDEPDDIQYFKSRRGAYY